MEARIHEIVDLDAQRRSLQQQTDALKAEQNVAAKQIGMLMKQGKKEEAEAAKARTAQLKADEKIPAEGLVIESHMEVGKGSVVNLLVTGGELKTGEFIVAGSTYGKVRTMLDFKGKPKGKATPSTPVTVTGFKELPNFGDQFVEAENEKVARKQALLNAFVKGEFL